MNSNKHLQINKYFAFVFMMFAVMSGVSDDYSEADVLSLKGSASSYFLNINQLQSKDISRIKVKLSEKKQNAFSSYVQHMDSTGDTQYRISIAFVFGALGFAMLSFNNHITQNNLWRETVF